MKVLIKIAMLATFSAWGTVAALAMASDATASKPAADRLQSAATDNMAPYRNLAADTLKAFKAHDMPAAKKSAKQLEKAWDDEQKNLKKKSPAVWTQIDDAMDDFIKPIAAKAPDAAKVQAAYDTFVAKLQLAVRGA